MHFVSKAHLAAMTDQARTQFYATHLPFGVHPETKDTFFVPLTDLFSGSVLQGVQGVGKSGLMESLIASCIRLGLAVVVVDPHGDLVDHAIAQLPDTVLPRVRLLDMTDEEYPFGVNVFAVNQQQSSIAQAQSIDRIVHIFNVLWPETESQQNLPRYLRAAIITLLANPGSTLVDMYRLLRRPSERLALMQRVTDPTVLEFWQAHDELTPSAQMQQVAPLINRLEALFMGRSLVRNIVGQRQTTIDFRKAIENREIIFIKLPLKTMADARLIGTMLIAQIHAALFSFADIPLEQRPGFCLFVDEFQNFATPDFAEMFSEGRKFGVRVVLAHQYRNQLPAYLQDSTMTARTKAIFQVTPDDANELSKLFPQAEAQVQPSDLEADIIKHLLSKGVR